MSTFRSAAWRLNAMVMPTPQSRRPPAVFRFAHGFIAVFSVAYFTSTGSRVKGIPAR